MVLNSKADDQEAFTVDGEFWVVVDIAQQLFVVPGNVFKRWVRCCLQILCNRGFGRFVEVVNLIPLTALCSEADNLFTLRLLWVISWPLNGIFQNFNNKDISLAYLMLDKLFEAPGNDCRLWLKHLFPTLSRN